MVVSDWNREITHEMLTAAIGTLLEHGLRQKNIKIKFVPGSFELPLAAQFFATNKKIDAVIAIGCVIRGETSHFDFICNACSDGIMEVSLKYNKPVIFGVLTVENLQQAKDRAGGKYGNKGTEAAETALRMIDLQKSF